MNRDHLLPDDPGRAIQSGGSHECRAGSRLRSLLFTVMVITAFVLGFYSLFLAYANTGKAQSLNTDGLRRTATSANTDKIKVALGTLAKQDLVFVVLDMSEVSPDPGVEIAAEKAARALADSGLAVSVRFMDPGNPDFAKLVTQNGISRFPAVLAVKENGGIVLITDDLSEKNLLNAFFEVWGKTSSCEDAKSGVY